MTDLVTLQSWLAEAETARHKLLTGSLRQTVRYNGDKEVTFAKTDLAALDGYITSLKARIAQLTEASPVNVTRPLYLAF